MTPGNPIPPPTCGAGAARAIHCIERAGDSIQEPEKARWSCNGVTQLSQVQTDVAM